MSRPIRGQGAHSVFPIGPKNTNLVEDIEFLLPVRFRWIPFNGFRGEVENVSVKQRPGGHLVFPIGPKNTNLVEDVEILLPVKFRWIPFSDFRGEVENVSANQRNTNLAEDVEILLPVKFRWIPFKQFQGRNRKREKLRTTDNAFGSGALKRPRLPTMQNRISEQTSYDRFRHGLSLFYSSHVTVVFILGFLKPLVSVDEGKRISHTRIIIVCMKSLYLTVQKLQYNKC